MKNAYFISGLGAQCRIFDKIQLPVDYQRHYLEFIIPDEQDDLVSYAHKMGQDIPYGSIVIGLSLGGMITTEIVKNRPDLTGILISSIPVKREFPKYLNLLLNLRLNRYLSEDWVLLFFRNFKNFFINDNLTHADNQLLLEMLEEGDFDLYLWFIEAIKLWNNKYYPSNIIRIHGTADNVFPIKDKSKIDYIIKGGSHVMLLDRYAEINHFLSKVL